MNMTSFKMMAATALLATSIATGGAQASIVLGPVASLCAANGCFAPPAITNILSFSSYTDFNSGFALPSGYSGSGSVVNGNLSGVYAAPAGDTSNYLTVGGGQSITITPGGTHNVFGLYWGSVDSYNSISFIDGLSTTTFTGLDVSALANGNQTIDQTNLYVTFMDIPFTSVVLNSGQNAFETDNHLVGDVPEPSTIALIGMALLSMFGIGLMRKRVQA